MYAKQIVECSFTGAGCLARCSSMMTGKVKLDLKLAVGLVFFETGGGVSFLLQIHPTDLKDKMAYLLCKSF